MSAIWSRLFPRPKSNASETAPRTKSSEYGFKTLFSCPSASIDIIAIHGLNGDREESWTGTNANWLRDFLPKDITNARILTYGYDAYVHGREQLSVQTLKGHALDLLAKLDMFRKGTPSNDFPIIFIAHDLGGIVLKSALISASSCHDKHLPGYKHIFDKTGGIVFLGTPNQGTDDIYLGEDVEAIPASKLNNTVAKHLENNSEMLQRQLAQYLAISSKFTTAYLYENIGKIVPKHTAVVQGAANVVIVGLNRTHDRLGKFDSIEESDYKTVLGSLRHIIYESKSITTDEHQAQTVDESIT